MRYNGIIRDDGGCHEGKGNGQEHSKDGSKCGHLECLHHGIQQSVQILEIGIGQFAQKHADLSDVASQLLEIRIGITDGADQTDGQNDHDKQRFVPLKVNGIFDFHCYRSLSFRNESPL